MLTESHARLALDDIRARRPHNLSEDDVSDLLEVFLKYTFESNDDFENRLLVFKEKVQDALSDMEGMLRDLDSIVDDLP